MKSKATQIELYKLRQIQIETDLKCHNFNINGNSDTLPLATSFRQKYVNNVALCEQQALCLRVWALMRLQY